MSDEVFRFRLVIFIVAVGWIVGGFYMVFFPEKTVEINRKYVPKKSWEVLARLGVVRPMVVRIWGCIAVPAGIALLVAVLFFRSFTE